MKTLLIFPPGWSPVGPYLALPVLKSYLKEKKGLDADIRDLNVLFYDNLLSLSRICEALEQIERSTHLDDKELLTIDLIKHSALKVDWAKQVFRSDDYFDIEKREYAQNILRDALYILNHSPAGISYSFNDIILPYSHYSTESVLAATEDRETNPFFEFYLKTVIPEINQESYELIGISVSGSFQVISAITLAKLIKEYCPCVKHITLGGNYITRLAEKTFKEWHPFFTFVDSIMLYDGEDTLANLISSLDSNIDLKKVPNLYFIDSGKIQRNKLEAPHSINDCVPDFTGFALDKYFMPELVLPIYSSRQCFNRCAFCTIPGATAGRYRTMSPERVYEIMCTLNKKYGSRIFSFVDETFETKRMVSLAKIITSNNKEFYWHGETRFTPSLTLDDCSLLYESGCRQIQLGLESYNQRVLDLMKKNTKVSWIDSNINAYLSAGIPVHLFFMVGFPSETEAEALNTLRYTETTLYRSKKQYHVPYSTRGFAQFGLDIGSDVWNNPEKYQVSIVPNTANYDLRLNVRYETKNGLSPYRAKELADQHHIDFYLQSLKHEEVPFELPERLHISEVTWILDSIHSVSYKSGIRCRKQICSLSRESIVKIPEDISISRSGNCIFFYNARSHSAYSMPISQESLIDQLSQKGISKDGIVCLPHSIQTLIEEMLFYGILSANEDPIYINNSRNSKLVLNTQLKEIESNLDEMHLLLSLPTHKMCRLNSFCFALLDLFKDPISAEDSLKVLNESGISIDYKPFMTFVDKCILSDVLHVLV